MSPRSLCSLSVLCALWLSGCGASRQSPTAQHAEAAADEPEGSVDEYEQRLSALDAQLGSLLGRVPDATSGAAEEELEAEAPEEDSGVAGEAPGAPQPSPAPAPRDAPAAMSDADVSAEESEEPPLSRCDLAGGLVARICELSSRICGIAQGGSDPELRQRCEDARRSCERARAELAEACPN